MTAIESLHAGYRSRLRTRSRTSELHESNRVEGLGPEYIAETYEILRSKQAEDIASAINRYTLIRAMDVLGYGAKPFAEQLLALPDPTLTDTDDRSMHGLLMGRSPSDGHYKKWFHSSQYGNWRRHARSAPTPTIPLACRTTRHVILEPRSAPKM